MQATGAVTELTGIAGMTILGAVPTAIALTLVAMWLYRRSVLAEMQQRSSPGALANLDARLPSEPARVNELPTMTQLSASWRAGLKKYGASGFVYAGLATLTWFLIDEIPFLPGRTVVVLATFFWPFLLLMCWFFAKSGRDVVLAMAGYVGLLLAVGLLSAESWYDPFVLWGMLNGPATVLTLGFLWHRVRAVGPLALAFVLFLFLGASLGMVWLSRNVRLASELGSMVGASAEGVLLAVIVAGVLPAVALGLGLLRLLGSLYRRKQLSDHELLTDAVVFTFSVFLCLHLTFAGAAPRYFSAGFIAFAGYYLTSRLLRPHRDQSTSRAPRLLLLRVFGAPAAASKLWLALGNGWRHLGTVCMIGGPDLAASALEPHRFLDFIGRKLKSRFLRDSASLERALLDLDERTDADGRYPVNELYCWDDTWRAAFRAFTDRCDVILLDLRGFNEKREGTAFELAELALRRLLSRTVLLVDSSTDEKLVASILASTPTRDGPPRKLLVSGTRIPTMALTQTLIEATASAAPAATQVTSGAAVAI